MYKTYSSKEDTIQIDASQRKGSNAFDQMESLQERTRRLVNTYADRISLSGLEDVRQAPPGLWKVFWTVSMLSCHIALIYLSVVTIVQHLNDSQRLKTETNIQERQVETLPFPNVTVCAPTQWDTKSMIERIIIPPDVEKYTKKRFKTQDELLEAFLVYIAYSSREKPQVQERDYPYFDQIFTATTESGRESFSADVERYFFNCSQIVESCKFDGEPFDCCHQSIRLYIDDGVCFTFRTDLKKQAAGVETSYKSGLELEMSADWRNVPPTYTDMTDGFLVQVGSVFSLFSDAVGVPNGMQLTVRLTLIKNTQQFKCIRHNAKPPVLKYFSFYDPNGYNCYMEGFEDVLVLQFLNCLIPFGNFVPNDSVACNSKQGRILHDVMYGKYEEYSSQLTTDKWTTGRKNGWLHTRSLLRNIFYNGKCQPFCTTWEHSMHIGYSELSPHPTTVHPHYSRSRIKVFFSDSKYLESIETPAFDIYTLFIKLGYLAGLYAGLSIVGFVELLTYGLVILRYWIMFQWKMKKEKTGPYKRDTVKSIRKRQNETEL